MTPARMYSVGCPARLTAIWIGFLATCAMKMLVAASKSTGNSNGSLSSPICDGPVRLAGDVGGHDVLTVDGQCQRQGRIRKQQCTQRHPGSIDPTAVEWTREPVVT